MRAAVHDIGRSVAAILCSVVSPITNRLIETQSLTLPQDAAVAHTRVARWLIVDSG
jgi:hypothetical protein